MNQGEEDTGKERQDNEAIQAEMILSPGNAEGAGEPIPEDELASFSKTQLADKLDELLSLEDVQPVTSLARMIRERYDSLVKEEYERKLALFTQDGSPAEEFEPAKDPLDEKFEKLFRSFNKRKTDQRNQKEKSQVENLSTKKIILEELKELIKGEENFTKSYQKFQALQSKWRSTGNVPPAENQSMRESWHFLTGRFYDMVKISNELRDLDRKKNKEHKTELCEKAEKLVEEPSLGKALKGLRLLQEEWKETGFVDKEHSESLWSRFKAAGERIYERKKLHAEQQLKQQEENLVKKTQLCEQLETLAKSELATFKICRDASEKAEAVWAEWQKTAFVPPSDNGACWKRFKKARQTLYSMLDVFYAKQREQFGQNLEKKTALCVQAESIQESNDWNATAETLKKLQVDWKNTGPVARKDSDAIWNRFRKACDHFFERKAQHHASLEESLRANIKVREDVIAKTEQFKPVSDMQQNLDEVKKLQEEWAAPCEVPFKERDRLNNAFGKAIENLLERIKENSGGDNKLFYRLKYEQMLKSPQGTEQVKRERFALQDKIKRLQTEAIQLENNLSFFGKAKNSSPLLTEYKQKLEGIQKQIQDFSLHLKMIPKPAEPVTTDPEPFPSKQKRHGRPFHPGRR